MDENSTNDSGTRTPGGRGSGRVRRRAERAVSVMAVLLAACAGASDTLAFFGLGKAFAGIVTGNLVTAGYGIATGNPSLIKPNITAVAGFVVGDITWAWLLRRPGTANRLLIAELALFLLVLAGWLATGSHPAGISALILLALLAVALGGQSIWALRIHQTTTYFTGMVTKTINAAVSTNAGIATGLRQLGALLAGAILTGLVLHVLRPAAPAVPMLLLAAAATVNVRTAHQGDGSPLRGASPDDLSELPGHTQLLTAVKHADRGEDLHPDVVAAAHFHLIRMIRRRGGRPSVRTESDPQGEVHESSRNTDTGDTRGSLRPDPQPRRRLPPGPAAGPGPDRAAALVSTGLPWEPLGYNGVTYHFGQANNALVYPGLGLGTIVAGATRVTDGMILAAAEAVAGQADVTAPGACLLPMVPDLRASSATAAIAVARAAAADGMATRKPDDMVQAVHDAGHRAVSGHRLRQGLGHRAQGKRRRHHAAGGRPCLRIRQRGGVRPRGGATSDGRPTTLIRSKHDYLAAQGDDDRCRGAGRER